MFGYILGTDGSLWLEIIWRTHFLVKRAIIGVVAVVSILVIVVGVRSLDKEAKPFDEKVVVVSLLKYLQGRTGELPVLSRVSDCRTDGMTHAPVSADLFGAFLRANGRNAMPLSFDGAAVVIPSGTDPWRARREQSGPILAVSRVGVMDDQSLVCVEVYASDARAFFFVLERTNTSWEVVAEHIAWEPPPEEDLGPEEFVQ